MINIRLLVVGNLKEKFWADAVNEYFKRLTKYCKVEVVEIKESDKRKEAKDLRDKVKGHCILCDINGNIVSSEQLAGKIGRISMTNSAITFIVGGSDGVSEGLHEVINERISFGRITLPHQLFRVVLCEQIYRAFTIMKGEKYHK